MKLSQPIEPFLRWSTSLCRKIQAGEQAALLFAHGEHHPLIHNERMDL
jgi:hypothetical protein